MQRLLNILAVAFVFFWVSFVQAQDNAKARQEGEVVWYTNIPLTDAKMLASAFEMEYPAFKVKFVVAGAGSLMNRLIVEAKSGKYFSDVVEFPADKFAVLKESIIEPYCPLEARFYPSGHKDKDCYWSDAGASYKVLAYNTLKVTGDDIPKDWDDFLLPKWKDRISLPTSNMLLVYQGFIQRWGRERARKYMTALANNGVVWEERGQGILPKLVAGEIPLTSVSHNLVETQKKVGAPVEWVKTARPIVSQMQVVGLLRNAPNPEAAKLFIDFLLSKRGQEIKQLQERISGRNDMPCPLEKVDCGALDILPVQPPSLTEFLEIQEEFRKITNP